MKALIVYFSHSGNTRALVRQIQEQAGGDIVELQPVEPYPSDYNAVVQQAKRELNSGFKPALRTSVNNLEGYDTIFAGSPNWCNTIAPPLQSFLSANNFSGKTVLPFVTHGGGGFGRSFADIAALCPGATVLEGLALYGGPTKATRNEISAWLTKLGIDA